MINVILMIQLCDYVYVMMYLIRYRHEFKGAQGKGGAYVHASAVTLNL